MSIVTSTHTVGPAQRNGRAYVVESHTDSQGKIHRREYLAATGADYVAIRTARVAQIESQLAEEEANALIGDSWL